MAVRELTRWGVLAALLALAVWLMIPDPRYAFEQRIAVHAQGELEPALHWPDGSPPAHWQLLTPYADARDPCRAEPACEGLPDRVPEGEYWWLAHEVGGPLRSVQRVRRRVLDWEQPVPARLDGSVRLELRYHEGRMLLRAPRG